MTASFQRDLVDVHGNYRGGRISHETPDELITDTVTARTLRPHILRAVFFLALFVVLTVAWAITSLIAALSSGFGVFRTSEQSSSTSVVAVLLGLAMFLTAIGWIVSLFLPLREPIAEYSVLVEGRAPAFPFVYSWIADTAIARRSPFQLRFGLVRGVPVLLAANARVRGMVTVRQVGTDLFLGWHLWRNRSTMTMLGNLLCDMFEHGQAWAPAGLVRSGWSAAMRELLHSITREGAQAAILDAPPDGFTPSVRLEQLADLDGVAYPAGPTPAGPVAPPPPPPPPPPAPATGPATGSWWNPTP